MSFIDEEDYRCPITKDFMSDPVITADGQTYERSAIEEWLSGHFTSPLSGARLTNNSLTPNITLKRIIRDYLAQQNPVATTVVAAAPIQHIAAPIQQIAAPIAVAGYVPPKLITKCEIVQQEGSETRYLMANFAIANGDSNSRKPAFMIFVLDISGSMNSSAPAGKSEQTNITRLTLAIHSILVAIQALSANDMFAIITFNYSPTKLQGATNATAAAKAAIAIKLKAISADGGTSIWYGLNEALELAKVNTTHDVSILALTDGIDDMDQGSICRSVTTKLAALKKSGNTLPIITTIAFGYDVNSRLLEEIAKSANGAYYFIPDGSMVGTVFVNAISNILSIGIMNLSFTLQTNGVISKDAIPVGSILYGQSRTILHELPTSAPASINSILCHLSIETNTDNAQYDIIVEGNTAKTVFTDIEKTNTFARYKIIDVIGKLKDTYPNHDPDYYMRELGRVQYPVQTEYVRALLTDINDPDVNKGQIGKAVESEKSRKQWGMHYLRCIYFAHRNELCFNFKDAAIQYYKGDCFTTKQSEVEEIFMSMPITQPAAASFYGGGYGSYNGVGGGGGGRSSVSASTAAQLAQPVTISPAYYNVSGGCISANMPVTLPDGTQLPACQIKPGNRVVSLDSSTGVAEVICVLKLRINGPTPMILLDDNCFITPYHPMYVATDTNANANWIFPCDYDYKDMDMSKPNPNVIVLDAGNYMYDFILDVGHTVMCNNKYNIACLAHGIITNSVIAHEYFGTLKIIADLKSHSSWQGHYGYITLDEWEFVRDPVSNAVCGLLF
uniref:VWFA domain-containing protein n=1 Tax=viral metagenome TaxID=1070528 RepID=A0A6C0HLP4_9ZZZZ